MIFDIWSVILLSHGLDSHSWSDSKEKGVSYITHLQMSKMDNIVKSSVDLIQSDLILNFIIFT